MKSAVNDVLPLKVRRALAKLGHDIGLARRKRHLTVASMTERVGVAKSTYLRVERGDTTVAMGVYAMALFVLGLSDGIEKLADPGHDDQGLLIDAERLPKRVRQAKATKPL